MERSLRNILLKTVKALHADVSEVAIEIPKDEGFGDLSTPLAMGLARSLKKAPKKIAEDIINAIPERDIFEKIEIAGPGFINFTFNSAFLLDRFKLLAEDANTFLTEDLGKGKRIQIEFVSANPTGPMHLGHGRGAALGAALANLLAAAGFRVEKEFYINDAGRQVKLLGLSVFAKYRQLCGQDVPVPEDGYRGDYVEDLAREFKDSKESSIVDEAALLDTITVFAYKKMLAEIKKDLEDFGVIFDSWQSEQELYEQGDIISAMDDLKGRGHIFEEEGAVWFRSTSFGDDKDRVLIKKDGDYTYFTPDIAYHRRKIQKGFDELIDIWGADHHGYIPRMQAVIESLGYPRERLRVLLVQMVSLLKAGQPVQMSKRAGEFITLREVMDDIGPDTTKFLFLTRRSDSHLEVDIEVAKAQSSENPVFYVQYAYARINSIFEKAREAGIAGFNPSQFDGSLLNDEEFRIVKKLLLYPMLFRNAALAHEPHRITFYIQELAGMFHPYYHRYKVVTDNDALTQARLALCNGIRIVLRHGLDILGVKAPERM